MTSQPQALDFEATESELFMSYQGSLTAFLWDICQPDMPFHKQALGHSQSIYTQRQYAVLPAQPFHHAWYSRHPPAPSAQSAFRPRQLEPQQQQVELPVLDHEEGLAKAHLQMLHYCHEWYSQRHPTNA